MNISQLKQLKVFFTSDRSFSLVNHMGKYVGLWVIAAMVGIPVGLYLLGVDLAPNYGLPVSDDQKLLLTHTLNSVENLRWLMLFVFSWAPVAVSAAGIFWICKRRLQRIAPSLKFSTVLNSQKDDKNKALDVLTKLHGEQYNDVVELAKQSLNEDVPTEWWTVMHVQAQKALSEQKSNPHRPKIEQDFDRALSSLQARASSITSLSLKV